MTIKFSFEKKHSPIFGTVYRPVALISFWSKKISGWEQIPMIVDTGADYSLLPSYLSHNLGVDLEKDCLTLKDNIPPLLGRQGFLEILKMTMENHVTTFEF